MTELTESPSPNPGKRRWWLWIIILALIGGAASWFVPRILNQESAPKGPDAAARAIPVVAATARTGDLKLYLSGLGSATALNVVTLRSRVDGQLVKVAFLEGQRVKEGDLLAEIDPRPFQAQLLQAEGQLARDEALLKNARVDLERNQIAKDAVSAQQLATQAALVAQYEGVVKSDQAQVETVKLQLSYCRITAPIAGRVGLRLVDQGNIVHAGDAGGLAVITQVQPISVVFTLPSDALAQIVPKLNSGRELVVEAFSRDLRTQLAVGKLLAVDNQIDSATGTIRLKAVFANDNDSLFPNQFVNARLLIDTRKGTLLLPTAAIQRGPSSTFVYVVKSDNSVEMRPVVVGPSEGDLTSVESGLSNGEAVVTEGVDKLQQGTKVAPRAEGGGASKVKP